MFVPTACRIGEAASSQPRQQSYVVKQADQCHLVSHPKVQAPSATTTHVMHVVCCARCTTYCMSPRKSRSRSRCQTQRSRLIGSCQRGVSTLDASCLPRTPSIPKYTNVLLVSIINLQIFLLQSSHHTHHNLFHAHHHYSSHCVSNHDKPHHRHHPGLLLPNSNIRHSRRPSKEKGIPCSHYRTAINCKEIPATASGDAG